jgi:hypothetical protein
MVAISDIDIQYDIWRAIYISLELYIFEFQLGIKTTKRVLKHTTWLYLYVNSFMRRLRETQAWRSSQFAYIFTDVIFMHINDYIYTNQMSNPDVEYGQVRLWQATYEVILSVEKFNYNHVLFIIYLIKMTKSGWKYNFLYSESLSARDVATIHERTKMADFRWETFNCIIYLYTYIYILVHYYLYITTCITFHKLEKKSTLNGQRIGCYWYC